MSQPSSMPTPVAASRASDPTPIGFALFGFLLLLFAVHFIWVDEAVVGLDYAALVGGLALLLSGILSVLGGLAYTGYVMTIFGFWTLGLYFLLTAGVKNQAFAPEAIGWYCLGLLVPLAYLAIPAIRYRNFPFVTLFVTLGGGLACLGVGQINMDENLVKASGWLALLGAALVWSVGAHSTLVNTGVLAKVTPAPHISS